MDVVDRGARGRRRAGGAARVDDRRAALGDGRDELVGDPLLVADRVPRRLAVDLRVHQVGVLRRRVVAPDGHVRDLGDLGLGLAASWAIARLWSRRIIAVKRSLGTSGALERRDQAVRVGRVADHQDLDVVGRAGVDRLALRLEDAAVGLEQVGALHALAARAGRRQQADLAAVERLLRVVVDLDRRSSSGKAQSSSSIAVPSAALTASGISSRCRWTLVSGPSICAGGDAEEDRVADLAGGAGDGDVDGVLG